VRHIMWVPRWTDLLHTLLPRSTFLVGAKRKSRYFQLQRGGNWMGKSNKWMKHFLFTRKLCTWISHWQDLQRNMTERYCRGFWVYGHRLHLMAPVFAPLATLRIDSKCTLRLYLYTLYCCYLNTHVAIPHSVYTNLIEMPLS